MSQVYEFAQIDEVNVGETGVPQPVAQPQPQLQPQPQPVAQPQPQLQPQPQPVAQPQPQLQPQPQYGNQQGGYQNNQPQSDLLKTPNGSVVRPVNGHQSILANIDLALEIPAIGGTRLFKGFTIVRGTNGQPFAGVPSIKDQNVQGKYHKQVVSPAFIPKGAKDQVYINLIEYALSEYHSVMG